MKLGNENMCLYVLLLSIPQYKEHFIVQIDISQSTCLLILWKANKKLHIILTELVEVKKQHFKVCNIERVKVNSDRQ